MTFTITWLHVLIGYTIFALVAVVVAAGAERNDYGIGCASILALVLLASIPVLWLGAMIARFM